MPLTEAIKASLKRGALVTAANWEVVIIQFIAESAFKALLVVPVVGAAFLVTLLVGSSVEEVVAGGLRQTVMLAIAALGEHRIALFAYIAGVAIVVLGGSVMTFVVKAGTVAVLVDAERAAPLVERPPLRVETVQQAEVFTLERFTEGSARFRRRFIWLGTALLVLYGLTGAVYLMSVLAAYRWAGAIGLAWAGPLLTVVTSTVLVVWITTLNLLYLLVQILVAARDTSVARAVAALPAVISGERRLVGGVFLVVLVLVLLATVASILATAALGFIGFVPVVGFAMLPLQLIAWLGRGLLFEFLGLAALTTYARVLRGAQSVEPGVTRAPALGQVS
ncbi:MAG TPA: hypothetical protein VFG86_06800 [Chloroflexota bacterium]|nr:hypothetical protein [Chloroflexota bacterium]